MPLIDNAHRLVSRGSTNDSTNRNSNSNSNSSSDCVIVKSKKRKAAKKTNERVKRRRLNIPTSISFVPSRKADRHKLKLLWRSKEEAARDLLRYRQDQVSSERGEPDDLRITNRHESVGVNQAPNNEVKAKETPENHSPNAPTVLPPSFKKVPCRANAMGSDHKFETAYFVIPDDIQHGQDLLCSHPACRARGVKFCFCAFCHLPVAKNNFKRRHSHDKVSLLPTSSSEIFPMQCLPVSTTPAIKLPCRSRFMPPDHTFETAHFTIPADVQHGQELICSYKTCREGGVKFCFCSHCQLPVAKRNFKKRHAHEAATSTPMQVVPPPKVAPPLPTVPTPMPATLPTKVAATPELFLGFGMPMAVPPELQLLQTGVSPPPSAESSAAQLPKKKMLKRRADGAASPPTHFQSHGNLHEDPWRTLLGNRANNASV